MRAHQSESYMDFRSHDHEMYLHRSDHVAELFHRGLDVHG